MTLNENYQSHPSRLLSKTWIDCLRSESQAAHNQGQLTNKQLALFYNQGWFKALVPKEYGGLQWTLSETVLFEEAIGWTDGSAGWTFTLCAGAGWFGGFMDAGFARKCFRAKKCCLAGSGAFGSATMLAGGRWKINGSWKYATGAPHATLFTLNAALEHPGNGPDQGFKSFCLLPTEVVVHKRWRAMGLKASASEAFCVEEQEIPANRAFMIDSEKPVVDEPLYRFPFQALAEATIAANISGMALHFLEELEVLWKEQNKIRKNRRRLNVDQRQMQIREDYLSKQFGAWHTSSQALHRCVGTMEKRLIAAYKPGVDPLVRETQYYKDSANEVSTAAQKLVADCRRIVGDAYTHTGLSGAGESNALNALWRDFQTGTQHALFEPPF